MYLSPSAIDAMMKSFGACAKGSLLAFDVWRRFSKTMRGPDDDARGTAAARRLPSSEACTVILSTAHAAKFPETVSKATGDDISLPNRCADLRERGEVFERISNDLGTVKDYIRANMVAEV